MRATCTQILLLSSWVLFAKGLALAQSPYRMEGIVTDADTQQPVANVTVQVLIESETDPALQIRKSHTNEDGRYSVELPAGHGWAWTLLPPAGYCPVEGKSTEVFATTVDRPTFTKNYQVRKGIPVRVMARYPQGLADPPKTIISLRQQKGNEYIHGFCELGDDGAGTVTLQQLTGKFNINCGDQNLTLVAPDGVTAHFDEGFDPRHVPSDVIKKDDGSTTVRDAKGATATLQGCDAVVRDNQLTIAIDLKRVGEESATITLKGRIVDADSNGIEGAAVTVAFHSSGGSASSQISAKTKNKGYFSVGVPKPSSAEQVALIITRPGYGGRDTKPMAIAAATDHTADAGTIKLERGCSLRIRVTGPDGLPLHGAVVEPLNDYASRTRIARTGPVGECLLTDLAPGLMRISARFGTLATTTKIPLDQGENELVIMKLAAPLTAPSTDASKEIPALAAGTAAPEWTIAEWTDGKERKLSDYRGKTVVLDFWGIWCGPCINGIPAMKQLQDRYKDQDVVFVGIHTAGTDMSLVKRLLKQQDWNFTVGLDTGEEIVTGKTVRRYAIHGYPSVIVIDRNGTIAFNSGDFPRDRELFMREMEAMARSAGLPWPIDKDATEEQALERMMQLQVVMFSRAIDKALKPQTD